MLIRCSPFIKFEDSCPPFILFQHPLLLNLRKTAYSTNANQASSKWGEVSDCSLFTNGFLLQRIWLGEGNFLIEYGCVRINYSTISM